LLIYHQAIAGKGHWYVARWLFFTLVTLELARLAKTYLRVRHGQSRDENPGATETILQPQCVQRRPLREFYYWSGAARQKKSR
jgi:hypothetical protein